MEARTAMPTNKRFAGSTRLSRTHLPDRAKFIGMSVREADQQLRLDGGGHGLLDTTHFDTVRFPPPEWALPVFTQAAERGSLAYSPYRGNEAVLAACSTSVSNLLGVPINAEENLALTTGTQGGLFTVLAALVDPGDVVALTDPEYLFVERMLQFLGAQVVRLPMRYGPDGAQPDLAELDRLAAGGIRLLITSNPNNPTGSVYSASTIRGIAERATRHDFLVVIDELYCRLVYDDQTYVHLAAQPGMADRTITLLGGSKTESLSGYRVGLLVGPATILDAVEQVIAMCSLRAPAYAQHLMAHWLVDDVEFVRTRVAELQAIRDMTVEALRTVPGVQVVPGAGTAYVWPDVSALGLSDIEVARVLQAEARVVVSPGYQFGPSGIGRLRICYARDETEWQAALERIVTTLRGATIRIVS